MLYLHLKAEGATLDEIKKACIAEVRRRREERLAANWQRECQEREERIQREIRDNPPRVDPEWIKRDRELEEKAAVLAGELWKKIWDEMILPRSKGVL